MIRTLALAAVAFVAFAGAAEASSVRVPLVGKSAAQVELDVAKAARAVCFRETRNETLVIDAFNRCVKSTTAVALANYNSALAQSNSATLAAR